jgi:hypothetical protein
MGAFRAREFEVLILDADGGEMTDSHEETVVPARVEINPVCSMLSIKRKRRPIPRSRGQHARRFPRLFQTARRR